MKNKNLNCKECGNDEFISNKYEFLLITKES